MSTKALLLIDIWDKHWDTATSTCIKPLIKKINFFAQKFRADKNIVIHCPAGDVQFESRILDDNPYTAPPQFSIHDALDEIVKAGFPDKYLPPIDKKLLGKDDNYNEWCWGKIHDKLMIDDSDYLSSNSNHILNILKHYGVEEVYYAGMHVNICMLYAYQYSIIEIRKNKIKPIVIEDLCLTLPVSRKDEIFKYVKSNICKVVNSEDVI